MRRLKLIGRAALALFVFGAFTASAAFAEEDKLSPQLLVLAGGNVAELEGTFRKSGATVLELVNLKEAAKNVTATATEIKLKNCKAESGSTTDTTLCEDVPFTFTGVAAGTLKCNNTGVAGEIKGLLDLHFAAEESSAKALEPLLLMKVLGGKKGTELTTPLEYVCGGILTVQLRGVIACLAAPGLTNVATTATVNILCKVSAARDVETGKCQVLCEEFGKVLTFEGSFDGGKTFEDVAFLETLEGKFNKDIFLDD